MTVSASQFNASSSPVEGELMLTDFTDSSDLGWYVMNDNVMGGRSEGGFELEQGIMSFTGRTNTDGGGFSSIRTQAMRLDLSNYTGIQLQLQGDGRRYTWRLESAARWRGKPVSYWADFQTDKGTWGMVNIPFSRFIPKFRGSRLDLPALDPGQITGMGLMIYDKQDGPFEVHLARVSAYTDNTPFTLAQYRWKNRVLVLSAPNEDDKDLIKQRAELALSPEAFESRDMALVTLMDDAVSVAGDRELTAEEAATARAALRIRPGAFALRLIGKDGSVKLAAQTATSMKEIYALIDSMPMRQREMD
jgi:hypothetical protein